MLHVRERLNQLGETFNINGILLGGEPMWRHCTMLVGGCADCYAVPEDEEDLRRLITGAEGMGMDWFVLGGGSNIVPSDRGIRGLVIDMRRFNEKRVDSAGSAGVTAVLGAGLDISQAAWHLGSSGLSGLHFLFGMPGSVGGAVWMNARCYGAEIADVMQWADVMDEEGRVHRRAMESSEWNYKKSPYQHSRSVILRAGFRLKRDDPRLLRGVMEEHRNDRETKGHYRAPCAGSAFKNDRAFGAPSGVLIDRCGLKGISVGGAAVSDWHANIFVNRGGAKACEFEELLNRVAIEVERSTGFRMEREVLTVGEWNQASGDARGGTEPPAESPKFKNK